MEKDNNNNTAIKTDQYTVSTEAMSSKRKAVQDYIIKYIGKISGSKENVELYKSLFASMSDREFDKFMQKLRDNEATLTLILPAGKDDGVKIENNLNMAKELGFDFFQKITYGPSDGLPGYTTPNKYLILKMPVRRAAQLLSKKISIPKDIHHTDYLSGQVTGESKASSLTLPELQVLIGCGADKAIKELLKARGGDLGELAEMNKQLYQTGHTTQANLDAKKTGVVSTNTLSNFLLAAHIRSTIKKRT